MTLRRCEAFEALVFRNGTPARVAHPYAMRADVAEIRRIYRQQLRRIDSELQELFSSMNENTVVVLTGDHGDHLGDHGHFGKASPFEPSLHVPLIVAGPQLRQGVVEEPVSLIDVPMTFIELAGLQRPASMQGYSLLPALRKQGPIGRPAVMSGLNYVEEFEVSSLGLVSLGRKHFDTASALLQGRFLKLICCPSGCRKQGRLLPEIFGPQVALMEVSERPGSFERDILSSTWRAEALHLATFLGQDFQEACLPLLHAL